MFNKLKKMIKSDAIIDKKSFVGYQTYIGKYSEVIDTTIGKYCSIASGCRIGLYNHNVESVTMHPFINEESYGFVDKNYWPPSKKEDSRNNLVIKNDVWIGTNAIILRGVVIGDGAVIGAGAVVTKDIPPYAIAVGNPAKIIKYRFTKEQISKLLSIKWWDWNIEKLRENTKYFYNIDDFLDKFYVQN